MSERIRNLEDALEILQGTHSNNPHPLLQDQLKDIKRGIEQYEHRPANKDELQVETHDNAGTLSISKEGTSRFSGHGTTEVSSLTLEPRATEQP